MSDMFDKLKDAVDRDDDGSVTDDATQLLETAKDSSILEKVEDHVEKLAEKDGTLGTVADKVDDLIDRVQGTKD